MAATGSGPPGAGGSGSLTVWERRYAALENWLPYPLLAVSTAMAVLRPDVDARTRLVTLGLAAAAALWVALLHTRAPRARRERALHGCLYVAGLLVLVALLMTQHTVFFIFAVTGFFHSALLRPRWLVYVGVGATSLLILLFTWEGLPSDPDGAAAFIAVLALQTWLIGYGVTGGEKLFALTEARRQAVRQLETTLAENEGLHAQLVAQAHEAGIHDERQRMAREIHDTLAQGLAGIITQLEAAEQAQADPQALRRHLHAAADLARDSLTEARRSVHALEPAGLAHGRLPGALERLVADWSQRTGVRVDLSANGEPTAMSTDVESALLRVAQESLANVAKHASATRVGVTLSCMGDTVTLDVRDDGVGFDPQAAGGNGRRTGFGLLTMRQRIDGVGGTLAVETGQEAGTAISATVPAGGAEPGDG